MLWCRFLEFQNGWSLCFEFQDGFLGVWFSRRSSRARFYLQRRANRGCRGHRCRLFSPPARASFLSRMGSSVPTARPFSSNDANSRFRAAAVTVINFFMQEKNTHEYVHSGRIELPELILVGTRITYEANGDAGFISCTIHLAAGYTKSHCRSFVGVHA